MKTRETPTQTLLQRNSIAIQTTMNSTEKLTQTDSIALKGIDEHSLYHEIKNLPGNDKCKKCNEN